MIRISSLSRSIASLKRTDPKAEARMTRIRSNLLEATNRFQAKQEETFNSISSELSPKKIILVSKPRTNDPEFELGRQIFLKNVLGQLHPPEIFSVAQISTLENLQLGVVADNQHWFRIPRTIPNAFLHFDKATLDTYFFFLDDLITSHLSTSFSFKSAPTVLRMTRDADFSIDLGERDTESIPDIVQSSVRIRDRGKPIRIQYLSGSNPEILTKITHTLKLSPGQIQLSSKTMLFQSLWTLVKFLNDSPTAADLTLEKYFPFIPKPFQRKNSIFERLKSKDYLLHHPYDSFQSYVSWIQAACADPAVEMIEQTIYRTDAVSPMIGALKTAAGQKKIRVLIEPRARFDELNNIKIAEELRQAGVEVSFGFGKMKLHAKVALVTRREGDGYRHYTHLSTGNYNSSTAQTYTDLALLTSSPDIGLDARHFFDRVSVGKIPTQFRELLSAPTKLHRKLLSLIEQETLAARNGDRARIVAKVNALVDEEIIQKLYEASQAGVSIDLIVRGACCLIPGVKGLSDNIQVISLVDRYLEHSRIYYFHNSKALYLSSADWMPRNFFSRLELAFPILDQRIYEFLEKVVIPAYLLDNVKAKELTSQGLWKKRSPNNLQRVEDWPMADFLKGQKGFRVQFMFQELAHHGYIGSSLTQAREERSPQNKL